ncbi:hypothetical protein D3C72_2526840 [compost metagenome]
MYAVLEPVPLVKRVEHNVIGVAEQLVEFTVHVSRCVDMHFLAHFLEAQPGFE